MLVLKTLARGPRHGYGIAQSIQRMSDDVLEVEEGSLYPALQRMLIKGWVTAEWQQTATGRCARVYSLTPAGRRRPEGEIRAFNRVTRAISRGIQPA